MHWTVLAALVILRALENIHLLKMPSFACSRSPPSGFLRGSKQCTPKTEQETWRCQFLPAPASLMQEATLRGDNISSPCNGHAHCSVSTHFQASSRTRLKTQHTIYILTSPRGPASLCKLAKQNTRSGNLTILQVQCQNILSFPRGDTSLCKLVLVYLCHCSPLGNISLCRANWEMFPMGPAHCSLLLPAAALTCLPSCLTLQY